MPDEAKHTLTWQKPMTSFEASKYHLTYGFIAAELYDATVRERDGLRNNYKQVEDKHNKLVTMLRICSMYARDIDALRSQVAALLAEEDRE